MKKQGQSYILKPSLTALGIIFWLAACNGFSLTGPSQQNEGSSIATAGATGQAVMATLVSPSPMSATLEEVPTASPSLTRPAAAIPSIETHTLTITHHTGDFMIEFTEPQDMSPCRSSEFASDGNTYVCYHVQGPTQELWLGSLDAGLTKLLWSGSCCKALWVPDQQAVVFAEALQSSPKKQIIKVLSIDTKTVTPLGSSYHGYFEFTPSHKFVYLPRNEWTLAQLVINPKIKLENEQKLDQLSPGLPFNDLLQPYIVVNFSPDGEKLALLEVADVYSDQHALSILDLKTKERIPVSSQVGYSRYEINSFSWSPDSQTLAYQTVLSDMQGAELRLVAADGSNSRLLTTTPERTHYNSFNWLPNGKAIIYASTASSGTDSWLNSEFFVISADGGKPQLLFSGGTSPHLMADGRILRVYREIYNPDIGRLSEAGDWLVKLFYREIK